MYDLPRYFKFALWMLISSLKVFTNDRFKCVVVRVKCDQNFPSQLFVLLTVDEFVGRGGGPLARQKQDATFMVNWQITSDFSEKSESSLHKRRILRNCEKGMEFLTCDGSEDEYN